MKMLDHQKTILKNLYHNRLLFIKELKKSVEWLSSTELRDLETWLKNELAVVYDREVQSLLRSAV